MSGLVQPATVPAPSDAPGDRFLALLPRVELHARVYFRFLPPDRKEEAVAETVALASYAARAVWSGRRLCGQLPAQDVLSEAAQRRHGFQVERLPRNTRHPFDEVYGPVQAQRHIDALEEILRDNTVTPPPDQAAFRIDFAAWRGTRTQRDRGILHELMLGERTGQVARKYGISAGRVSQLRRAFYEDWAAFCDADGDGP